MRFDRFSVILALSFLFFVNFVSAEIFIRGVEEIYNFGDDFKFDISIQSLKKTSGFFTSNIICDSRNIELFRSPYSLNANEIKDFSISGNFDNFITKNATGECFVEAIYSDEKSTSQKFKISREIEVSLDVSGVLFSPGQNISISGKGFKKNGDAVNGFVEVFIDGQDIKNLASVVSGVFKSNLVVPENLASENYLIKVKVYEKDSSGEITNEGISEVSVRIRQVVRGLNIALKSQNVNPEEEIVYTAILHDQAGNEARSEVSFVVYDPSGKPFKKDLFYSGEFHNLLILSNYTPGYWTIEAKTDNFLEKKSFYVEELERASFELINNTLIILNTGNVIYKKPVEVSIGGVNEVVEVELDVGQKKILTLSAPDGEYEIYVSDGKTESGFGSSFLTGKAISVSENNKTVLYNFLKNFLWIVIIIFAGFVASYYYRKFSKEGFSRVSSVSPLRKSDFSNSLSSLDKGEKQECGIVSLYLENSERLSKVDSVNNLINNILLNAKNSKAKIYVEEDYRIIVFAPKITNSLDNVLNSVKFAQSSAQKLREFNERNSRKIKFGISVNVGSLVIDNRGGNFSFTSVGGVIMNSKRMSQRGISEVLLSDNAYKKVLGSVIVDRDARTGFWRVKRVANRESHDKFIKGFLERQEED